MPRKNLPQGTIESPPRLVRFERLACSERVVVTVDAARLDAAGRAEMTPLQAAWCLADLAAIAAGVLLNRER